MVNLSHYGSDNLAEVVQTVSDLEVAFRQRTCFIRNLEGVDLLIGSRGNNLYTLSLGDMMVGISHETSVACSPQQNGVVERRNRTLIEAARTMLIYAQASLFLWAEAVATETDTIKTGQIEAKTDKTGQKREAWVTVQAIRERQNSLATSMSRQYTSGPSGNNSGKQRAVVCYNCKGEGHMSKQYTKPKRKRDEAWFKDKIALMENLSHYGSVNLVEVNNPDNVTNNGIDQDVQAMSIFKQSNIMNKSKTEITSDSNIILYS
nr:putative ribonuclease H-like domain-containing protein [Tanacetum cinerariifolium]